MIKQLNITHLTERAMISHKLNHDEGIAWEELKTYFLNEYNTTIPECGIKQVFLNILRTLNRQ